MGVNIKKVLEEKNKKLTGRELFLSDNTLNESDLKFLEVEGMIDIYMFCSSRKTCIN